MLPKLFLRDIVYPTLEILAEENSAFKSDVAAHLLVGTAWHESLGLKYTRQIGGPALGAYQIEPATHDDVYQNFLAFRPKLLNLVTSLAAEAPERELQLITNLSYSTAIARLVYWRAPDPMPKRRNELSQYIEDLAIYWKRHYNTGLGKGSVGEFMGHFPLDIVG